MTGTALTPAGSIRRVPGVSSGALYRRSAPRTRSPVAVRPLPGRVAAVARAGVARAGAADPTPYRATGRAARPPRMPRRLRVPPPTPSARSPSSGCSRLPLMTFTRVPPLMRSDADGAVRYLTGPPVMSSRRSVEPPCRPVAPALSSASLVMAQCRAPAGASNPCSPGPVPRVCGPGRPGCWCASWATRHPWTCGKQVDRSNCSAMTGKRMTLKSPAATSAAALAGLMACN